MKNILKLNVMLILVLSFILIACDSGNKDLNSASEANTPLSNDNQETSGESNDISSYENHTYAVKKTFEPADDAEFSVVGGAASFGKIYKNVNELYEDAANIISGEVLEITYSDEDAAAKTYYSFAVNEVLKGNAIHEKTIITVMEMQGYCRLSKYVEKYGADHIENYDESEAENIYFVYTVEGEPLIQKGDKYVLFLGNAHDDHLGDGYFVTIGAFMGRYQANSDELYERYSPEDIYYQVTDGAGRTISREMPMSYTELKEAVLNNN